VIVALPGFALPASPADITASAAFRHKYGFGLNLEREIVKTVSVFFTARLERRKQSSVGVQRCGLHAAAGGAGIPGRGQFELRLEKNH